MRLNAKQLRKRRPKGEELKGVRRTPIYIVLDDVMDTYNVGAIFRLADAVAVREVILCGKTEYPPNSRIHKAAVGTEEWVPWQYTEDAVAALAELRKENTGLKVVVVEQDARATPVSDMILEVSDLNPVAVVVGHETEGVKRKVLETADVIAEIPMYGINKSLNVVVATAIAVYKILEKGSYGN